MRHSEKKVLFPKDIEGILRSGQLCFLSLVDRGKPYVVPVHYGYAENALYIHSAPEGRKIDILRENPDVGFCIVAHSELVPGETACSWSTKFTSVTGTGTVSMLTEPEDKKNGLIILMSQYSDDKFDFSEKSLGNVVIIRVAIEEITAKSSEGGR